MNSLTFKIKARKKPELKKFLAQIGYKFEVRPNAVWLAKDEETAITLYQSNKLLIQGKEINKIVEILKAGDFLSLPKTPSAKLLGSGPKKWIGTDEAGKGDYFGPLVVAGVLVTEQTAKELWQLGVRDSKTLSDKSIAELTSEIKKLGHKYPKELLWSNVTINPKRYNELHRDMKNLNRILAWDMPA